jgi:hypothetical protein
MAGLARALHVFCRRAQEDVDAATSRGGALSQSEGTGVTVKIMTQEWARTRGVRQHCTRPLWSPLRHFWPKRAIGTVILQTDFCGNELTSEFSAKSMRPSSQTLAPEDGRPVCRSMRRDVFPHNCPSAPSMDAAQKGAKSNALYRAQAAAARVIPQAAL